MPYNFHVWNFTISDNFEFFPDLVIDPNLPVQMYLRRTNHWAHFIEPGKRLLCIAAQLLLQMRLYVRPILYGPYKCTFFQCIISDPLYMISAQSQHFYIMISNNQWMSAIQWENTVLEHAVEYICHSLNFHSLTALTTSELKLKTVLCAKVRRWSFQYRWPASGLISKVLDDHNLLNSWVSYWSLSPLCDISHVCSWK